MSEKIFEFPENETGFTTCVTATTETMKLEAFKDNKLIVVNLTLGDLDNKCFVTYYETSRKREDILLSLKTNVSNKYMHKSKKEYRYFPINTRKDILVFAEFLRGL